MCSIEDGYSLAKVSAAWPRGVTSLCCLGAPSTMWSSCDCINLWELISCSQEWERESGGWGHQRVEREKLNSDFNVIEQSQLRWIYPFVFVLWRAQSSLRSTAWFWKPEQRFLTWYSIELSGKRKQNPPTTDFEVTQWPLSKTFTRPCAKN